MTSTPSTGTTSPPSGTATCCGRDEELRVDALSFAYAAGRPAVAGVSFTLPAGAFLALLGESGSGKTTLLKLLGGYLTPAKGRIVLAGRDVTALPPERRRVGMVFQSYALFPHLSARGNVAFGLEVRGVARDEARRRVEAALDRVSLPAEARDRRPQALSGGQQQRVALARALVIEPGLLLLDEPLANLDRPLRDQVRGGLRTGVTTVLVTHDRDDALALADLVGVMAAGRLLQLGPPREVYERPSSAHVARLLGDANFLPGPTPAELFMVRPEHVRLAAGTSACVRAVRYRGDRLLVELDRDGATLLASVPADTAATVGDRFDVHVAPGAMHPLPREGPG